MPKHQVNQRKGKHMDLEERSQIEALLNEGHSFRYIGERLDRPASTISREVNNHAQIIPPKMCEDCLNFPGCTKRQGCAHGRKSGCKRLCHTCATAKKECPDYVPSFCEKRRDNPTDLCNGCRRAKSGYGCHFERRVYRAREAQRDYHSEWVEKRAGFDLTDEQIAHVSDVVSPLIHKGQSLYHITQTHGAELGISEATLRRMVQSTKLDARVIDLRDAVKRKPRRKKRTEGYKTMKDIKDGHKYEDFVRDILDQGLPYVEMDCVEGAQTSHSALLTLHFPDSSLQLAIIMAEHDSDHVVAALDILETTLEPELFSECFPVILGDNGHEFADLYRMEHGEDGHKRTTVYYCEPNRSDQKAHCENNHKYIRYIVPKGTDMDGLSQVEVSNMMDHINSFKRKHLRGKNPYQVGRALLPDDFFLLLGLNEIAPDEVHLQPDLIFPNGRIPKGKSSD